MFGPTTKYHGLHQDPIDGTPLTWSAHPEGFATRQGDTPALVEKSRAAHAGVIPHARSKVFRIPEDIGEYSKVLDWLANAGGYLHKEREQDLGDGKWVVWLTWFDMRGFIPKDNQMPDNAR